MGREDGPRTGHTAERGIPDGLLVGLLAFLFGLTIMAWLATGLAGLFAHGAWPEGVTFTRTPLALRHLLGGPQDLPAAWPDTPADQLSGYGLFWGLLIGELMVLIVLAIFVLGTLARWRAVRETHGRGKARAGGASGEGPAGAGAGTASGAGDAPHADTEGRVVGHGHTGGESHPGGPWRGAGVGAPNTPGAYTPAGTDTPHAPGTNSGAPATDGPPAGAPAVGGPQGPVPGPHLPGAAPGTPPGTCPPGAVPAGTTPPGTLPPGAAAPVSPNAYPSPYPATTDVWANPAVPAPRIPRVLYGGPETRRPTTVQAVLDAEGPVLVVTSDPSVWAETKDARAKLGPVLVYDPGHLCDTPARLHWSPTAGCEKADVAAARAVALLAPVRPQARLDAAMADTAETLLSSWLHAAAVDGRPFRQVHRWAQGHSAHEAVRILRTHAKASSGAAGLLESALTAHPERREVAQELTVRALAALSSIHIREACNPNRTDSLTLESFVDEGGTLYVVGEAIEDPRTRPGAMPLLTALAADVVEHGRRMAARSSDGRLDPPMTLVLDDVAAVAPLPRLPELLSAGRDQGLPILVLLRSQEQGRARWPDHTLTD